MSDINKDADYYKQLDEQYVRLAKETNSLAELCRLNDYDPDIGSVPEHWLPLYRQFFEGARQLGAEQPLRFPVAARSDEDAPAEKITLQQYVEAEKRLAALLGWEEQPLQNGKLFHRWKTPGGSIQDGRPYWAREDYAAFRLAADLEISTAYRNEAVFASFQTGNGQAPHVREQINSHDGKWNAVRYAITQAAIAKLESELETKPTPKSTPGMGA